jgi:amino acid transporter
MNAWVGSLSTFGQNLRYGGPQLAIFASLIAAFVQWTVTLGLSELASAFPSSGVSTLPPLKRCVFQGLHETQGQYHFMYILAPEKWKRFSAFVIGWMSVLAWWFATSAGLSLVAVSTTGLAAFLNPEYTPKDWHIYLCFLAMAFLSGALTLGGFGISTKRQQFSPYLRSRNRLLKSQAAQCSSVWAVSWPGSLFYWPQSHTPMILRLLWHQTKGPAAGTQELHGC